jgi:hypothetical protein
MLDGYRKKRYGSYAIKFKVRKFNIVNFLLFRVMEIQRICEVTATPLMEGANLSE